MVLTNITLANMFAFGRCHLLCRYLADANNGAVAGREYGRLYVLRNLWSAFRKTSPIFCFICCCCRSMPFVPHPFPTPNQGYLDLQANRKSPGRPASSWASKNRLCPASDYVPPHADVVHYQYERPGVRDIVRTNAADS